MKKFLNKTLVALLSLAMAFTMTAAPVFADEDIPVSNENVAEEVLEETERDDVREDFSDTTAEVTETTFEESGETEEAGEDFKTTEPSDDLIEPECDEALSEEMAEAVSAFAPEEDELRDEPEETSDIDIVKEMISELPNCTDVTEADRVKIESAAAAYDSLSAEDQATLDREVGTYAYNTSQPYGRVLEVALWGLWSFNPIDNTTDLADGTYDKTTTPALSSVYSKGKSTSSRVKPWSVKAVKVENGKAFATITVESDTYTHLWMGGVLYPNTNTSGSGDSEFAGVPIDLNSTFYFAGVSSTMPVPIAFSLTTTINESGEDPAEEKADYSAVYAALDKVPEDLSIYTDESVKALMDAIDAVVYDKPASEQAEVDAMAQAIEDAIEALVLKAEDDERIDLTITNKTGMFKAVTAYILRENGEESLVVALSGTGYHELFKGTFEEAAANGDGTLENGNDTWAHGHLNAAGKWEFRIPLEPGDSFIPCVAISNSYYTNYLNGSNSLERSFFPRQFTLDREAKALETDDYNETCDFSVTSKIADFKAAPVASTTVVGGPNSNNYSVSPTLLMEDSTYDEVIFATVSDGKMTEQKASIKDGKFEISLLNAPGLEAFKDKEPIEMKFHVSESAPYKAAGQYVKRTVTIDKLAKTIVIDGTPLAEKGSDQNDDIVDPDDPIVPGDNQTGGGSGSTTPVNSSTTLPDGEYTPDSFSWSGGSGRLAYIRCLKITVKNGQAYATIEFSSPSYDAVKAAGSVYYKQGSGNAVFTIPVKLNGNNKIIGRTTAMSQPHWIEYTIYIGLAENPEDAGDNAKAKQDAAEAKMKISDEAPTIVGLEAVEDGEYDVEYAEYFKIFCYEHGVRMLSIDISGNTALKEEYTENALKALENSQSADELEYDEEGNIIAMSKGEIIEGLYKNNVINYLLVPEDFEVPAGLDKEYIIVTIPAENSFAASPEAVAMMEELGCLDYVSLLGLEEEDIESEELKRALEEGEVETALKDGKFDYAKVVKDKSGLAILSGELLPEEVDEDAEDYEDLQEEAKEKQETLEKMESRFTTLEVPVLIDRSIHEEEELARAEWIKVYGVLFGCEDLANEIFDNIVKEAKQDDKN